MYVFLKKTNKLCFTVESRNNSCEIIETTDKLPPEKSLCSGLTSVYLLHKM